MFLFLGVTPLEHYKNTGLEKLGAVFWSANQFVNYVEENASFQRCFTISVLVFLAVCAFLI